MDCEPERLVEGKEESELDVPVELVLGRMGSTVAILET